jgi:hypothetical protein
MTIVDDRLTLNTWYGDRSLVVDFFATAKRNFFHRFYQTTLKYENWQDDPKLINRACHNSRRDLSPRWRSFNVKKKKKKLGGTRVWTGDLSICSRMLYHWAIPPTFKQLHEGIQERRSEPTRILLWPSRKFLNKSELLCTLVLKWGQHLGTCPIKANHNSHNYLIINYLNCHDCLLSKTENCK